MEDDKTTYVIDLDLETNFSEVLKGDLPRFEQFISESGNLTRKLERTVNQLGGQVASNIRSMFQKTSIEVNSSLIASRNLMKNVMSQGIEVSKTFEKSLDKVAERTKKLKDINAKISGWKKEKESSDTESEDWKSRKAQIDKEYTEDLNKLQKIDKIIEGIGQKFNYKIGKMSADASETLVASVNTCLQGVEGVAEKSLSEVKKIKNEIESMDDISKLFKYKDISSSMVNVKKDLDNALREQNVRTLRSEEELSKAKIALARQTSEVMAASNRKFYEQTIQNNTIIRQVWDQTESAVESFGNEIDVTRGKAEKLANQIQKGFNKSFVGLKQSLSGSLNVIDKSIEEKADIGGIDVTGNIDKKIKFAERSIDTVITKLNALKTKYEELGKTGFIDTKKSLSEIDEIFNHYRKKISETSIAEKQLKFLGEKQKLLKLDIEIPINKIKELENKILDTQGVLNKIPQVTRNNFLTVHNEIEKLNKQREKFVFSEIEIKDKIVLIEKSISDLRIKYAEVTNQKIKIAYEKLINELSTKSSELRKVISNVPSKINLESYRNEIKSVIKKIQADSKNLFVSDDVIKNKFEKIKDSYDNLIVKADKLNKKKFVSSSSIEDAKIGFEKIKSSIKKYNDEIEKVKNSIRELEKIQRAGLGSERIEGTIGALKNQINVMKSHSRELNQFYAKSQSQIDALSKRTNKSIVSTMWNTIRNFRWHIAGLIYLGTKTINFFKKTFVSVLEGIQEFNKNAMAIASATAYQLVGSSKEVYERAYEFGKNLMVKLEFQAAKTILTVEDLMMLTKTFTQAGIIPETDEDVRRIATIGTAIKALTEGMANAGVQMRQELYAIIQGRQRAVDQLATSFRMMGIDIQEVIRRAEEQGVSMIVALSDALKPYEEMNRMMEKEYETAINKLKTIWGILKRIGGEATYKIVIDDLNKISDILFQNNELTEKGKEIARGISLAMQTTWQFAKQLFIITSNIISTLVDILNINGEIISFVFNLHGNIKNVNSQLSGTFKLFKSVMYCVLQISLTLEDIAKTAKTVSTFARSPIDLLKSLMGSLKEEQTFFGNMKGFFKERIDVFKSFFGIIGANQKKIDEFEASWNKILEDLNKLSGEDIELGIKIKPPHPMNSLIAEIAPLEKKLNDSIKKSLTGLEKIDFTYDIEVEGLDKLRGKLETDLIYYKNILNEVKNGILELSAEQTDLISKTIQGAIEGIQIVDKLQKAASDKKIKDTNEYILKTEKQYRNLMREITRGGAETRQEKRLIWIEKMRDSIWDLEKTGRFSGEEIRDLWINYFDQILKKYQQDTKDIELENAKRIRDINKFVRDASGVGLTRFEEAKRWLEDQRDFLEVKKREQIEGVRITEEEVKRMNDALESGYSKRIGEALKKNNIEFERLKNSIKDYKGEGESVFAKILADSKAFNLQIEENVNLNKSEIKILKDLIAKREKELITIQKQNMELERRKLLLKVSGKEDTFSGKREEWLKNTELELQKLINKQGSKVSIDFIQQFYAARAIGFTNLVNKQQKELNSMIEDFENKLTSHRIKDPYKDLDVEFKKITNDIDEVIAKLNEKDVMDRKQIEIFKELKKNADVYKEERKQLLLLEQAHKNYLKSLDVAMMKADFMKDSYSPFEQQKGELEAIRIEYERSKDSIVKELEEMSIAWKLYSKNWDSEHKKQITDYRKHVEDQFVQLTIAMEREVWRKQNPLWNDMIEMSKSWADEVSDAIAEVAMDFEKLGDTLNNLQQKIIKDAIKAIAKRKFTDPLQDWLAPKQETSKEDLVKSAMSQLEKTKAEVDAIAAARLQFKEKYAGDSNALSFLSSQIGKEAEGTMDRMVAAGKPIPVYISKKIEDFGAMEAAFDETADATKGVSDSIEKTAQDTQDILDDGFNNMVKGILGLKNVLGEGGDKSSGIGGLVNKGIDWIKGLFGGAPTAIQMGSTGAGAAGLASFTDVTGTAWGMKLILLLLLQ